jgi:hypothetical protein
MKKLFPYFFVPILLVLGFGSQNPEPYSSDLFSIANIQTPSGYLVKEAPNWWAVIPLDSTAGPVAAPISAGAAANQASNQIVQALITYNITVTNVAQKAATNTVNGVTNAILGMVSNMITGKFQATNAELTTLAGFNGGGLTNLNYAVQSGYLTTSGAAYYTINFSHAWPDTKYTVTGVSATSSQGFTIFLVTSKQTGSCVVWVSVEYGGAELDWTATHWTQ